MNDVIVIGGLLLLVFFSFVLGVSTAATRVGTLMIDNLVREGLLTIRIENGEEVIYSGYKTPENTK